MDSQVKHVIDQCAADSYAGTISFGVVVGALMQAGVESYHADYRQSVTTYYMPNGVTCTVPLKAADVVIPQNFDAQAIQMAIRGAQRGEINYPQFIQLSMAAGCVGYIVWIGGRHVSYFGRNGEVHVEHFPPAK